MRVCTRELVKNPRRNSRASDFHIRVCKSIPRIQSMKMSSRGHQKNPASQHMSLGRKQNPHQFFSHLFVQRAFSIWIQRILLHHTDQWPSRRCLRTRRVHPPSEKQSRIVVALATTIFQTEKNTFHKEARKFSPHRQVLQAPLIQESQVFQVPSCFLAGLAEACQNPKTVPTEGSKSVSSDPRRTQRIFKSTSNLSERVLRLLQWRS